MLSEDCLKNFVESLSIELTLPNPAMKDFSVRQATEELNDNYADMMCVDVPEGEGK